MKLMTNWTNYLLKLKKRLKYCINTLVTQPLGKKEKELLKLNVHTNFAYNINNNVRAINVDKLEE